MFFSWLPLEWSRSFCSNKNSFKNYNHWNVRFYSLDRILKFLDDIWFLVKQRKHQQRHSNSNSISEINLEILCLSVFWLNNFLLVTTHTFKESLFVGFLPGKNSFFFREVHTVGYNRYLRNDENKVFNTQVRFSLKSTKILNTFQH